MERKNFNKNVQMHLACAKDDLRPIMACIYFKNGFAYATDGYILARSRIDECSTLQECDIQALDGKLLHANFFKDMLKYDDILISDEGIECHKGDEKAFFYFSQFTKFPDVDKVLQEALNLPAVPMPQISFDTRLLLKLSKALYGFDKCTATFKGTNNPIVFDSIEDCGSIGIMIPNKS
jgi:hypothetical protein